MTNLLSFYLAYEESPNLDLKELKRWFKSTGRKYGFKIRGLESYSEKQKEFFGPLGKAMSVTQNSILYVDLTVGRFHDIEAWKIKDGAAREMLEGLDADALWALRTTLPRPMSSVDLEEALEKLLSDREDYETLRKNILDCVNGYRRTSLCRLLDEIWKNPIFFKGMLVYGHFTSSNLFEIEWEDMLKDLWMQFCLYVDEIIGYIVAKS